MSSLHSLTIFGLVALLYARTFDELRQIWAADVNYSHGYLVPLVSFAFAYRGWRQSGPPWKMRVATRSLCTGLFLLVTGLILHAEAWFTGALLLDVVALVVILRGVLLVMGGRRASRAYGFATLFLLFLAPWPAEWHGMLANHLQGMVSAISAEVLAACGLPVLREGYLLHMPGHSIEVAEACSGMRQLTAFLAMSVAVGGLNRGSRWSNLALIAISIPVAVLANVTRILLTVLILVVAGPTYAKGAFHSLEGSVVAGIGLAALLASAAGLNALERRRGGRSSRPDAANSLFTAAQPQC